jgi:hypothetical protein
MRLQDCIVDVDAFVTAPLVRTEPESEWIQARDSGSIPIELFDLYCRANYLSFGGATRFLTDPDNVLFSYFCMIVRSVTESLADSMTQVSGFCEDQKLTYDAGKVIHGEPWDPEADGRARRHFRDLLIALHSSLDGLSDLISLFFTGLIPGLRLGRAQFRVVEHWLKRPQKSPAGIIVTPFDHYLRELFDALNPVVNSAGPETDWLPLMHLLRNKAAHLGQPVFRQVGLHDKTPKVYTFLPRQWPYIWERHMKVAGETPVASGFIPKFLSETLIHQDVVSYAQGLRLKVKDVVRVGISIVASTYIHAQDFEPNQSALAELKGSSETYAFEHFLATAS